MYTFHQIDSAKHLCHMRGAALVEYLLVIAFLGVSVLAVCNKFQQISERKIQIASFIIGGGTMGTITGVDQTTPDIEQGGEAE